jgi:RNA polymerase sigma-70 factor (ECF subfamily)
MGHNDEAGVSRSSENAKNSGHETNPALHVGAEMLALATVSDPVDPIVELIHAGRHRDALAACARTHHAILGRLAMALLGSQADADEAVQETLLRAHRGMASYRAEGSIKAWLCGIARHVCAHMLETRRRGRELLEIVPAEGEARDAFAARRRARVLRDALEKLKPSERESLVLRYVADLSHREIATACGLDEAAARKRISRALERLRSVMPTEEI